MVGEEIKISIGMGGFLVHNDNGEKSGLVIIRCAYPSCAE